MEQLGEGPSDSSECISTLMSGGLPGIRDFTVPMPTLTDMSVNTNG